MKVQKVSLLTPDLEDVAKCLGAHLAAHYQHVDVSVAPCPDLREAPFCLATEGLSGDEKIADVGGQQNLFPRPLLDKTWSMADIAAAMEMSPTKGGLIGAGAGPFHVIGQNSELMPNMSWKGGLHNIDNQTRYIQINRRDGAIELQKSESPDCGLMVNLFGSLGEPGPVLNIRVRGRKVPERSLTEVIRKGLSSQYGKDQAVSLGGVFAVTSGRARYHIMPDFPTDDQLPFRDRAQVEEWLTYHDFDAPIVCLSVLHSADPEGLGLRMEHTHAFSPSGQHAGGHYHYDDAAEGDEEIEYHGYFNIAKTLYRVDNPAAQ